MNKEGMKRKFLALLLLGVGIMLGSTQITFAYVQQKAKLLNQFELGEVKVAIVEDFNEERTIKSNVTIQNEGNIPVYVRATITIYWQDSQGNLLMQLPIEGKDYVLLGTKNTIWMQGEDGFWYYTVPVNVGEKTSPLIEKCTDVSDREDEKILVVDVVAQAIQAFPQNAVEEAWKIVLNAKSESME